MHSNNHADLAIVISDERTGRHSILAEFTKRTERPPNIPMRGRAAYAAGRFARRQAREMARRAVA